MLSPEERRLIAGILTLLLLGAVVKTCRQRIIMEHPPKVQLPSLDASPKQPVKDARTN